MHIDDPLNEESAACVLDLSGDLNLLKVVNVHLKSSFDGSHVLVDILSHLSHHLRVSHLELVRKVHAFADCASELGNTLLENF